MILIVHGYDGSGDGHWQRWLEAELRASGTPVVFPDLPAPTAPCKDEWVAALIACVDEAAARRERVTLVCHSLGCWAVDHLVAERGAADLHAALLVAPPSPFLPFEPIETFLPPPQQADAWAPLAARTLLVGSDDDTYVSDDELRAIARTLGVACRILPGAGHVNVESGHGPWPFVLEWLASVGAR